MFSPVVDRFWSSMLAGASIEDGAAFSLVVDAALPDGRSVMIATSPDGGRVRAALSATRADRLGPARSAGIALHHARECIDHGD